MERSGNRTPWLPGLDVLRSYRREWLRSDVFAGLSVAAVSLPIGVAYARLAGFDPVVGIYSCILPPVAYAFFGTSRQLIVNPDAAACAILAATLAPIAAGDSTRYAELSIALTALTGVLCIAGGMARFGVIADFLSRPILVGYLNGIALSIIAGQLGTLLGIRIASGGFFHTLVRVAAALPDAHFATLATGVVLIVVILILGRILPRVPAPLAACAIGIGAVYLLGLDRHGVAVVGPIPPGFPRPHIPSVRSGDVWPLLSGAGAIALVSFCSMMTTARSFAARNHYAIDANRDMIALGVCDIASAFNRGFVVSGADSRTAVADASHGKTQATGLVAAAAMALVLLFVTGPLARLPNAALAAILISSALSLFDFASLRECWRVSKPEFRQSIVAMVGVMTIGVLPGILLAVGSAILRLLQQASRPHDAILGRGDGEAYCSADEGGKMIAGLLIYRFDASLLFFNADYFKDRVLSLCDEARPRWLLLDVEGMPVLDVTGADVLEAVRCELSARGTVLAIARAKGVFRIMIERTGLSSRIGAAHIFARVHEGAQAFLEEQGQERSPQVTRNPAHADPCSPR
jgi:high affinity sulfate transporter 1